MTRYDQVTSKSLEELAEWLDVNGQHDDSPWIKWFDDKYCSNCESEVVTSDESEEKLGFALWYKTKVDCAYCEVYNECRFFPNRRALSNKEIIELWLKEEVVQ
jgi:hypothetical protein